MTTRGSSLARNLLRRGSRGGSRRSGPTRRVLSFEHCEPRLTLSGTTGAVLSLSTLSPPNSSEGGFVDFVVTINSANFTSSSLLDSQVFEADAETVVVRLDDTTVIELHIRPSGQSSGTTAAANDSYSQQWIDVSDALDYNALVTDGHFRLIRMPSPPADPPPGEGGLVAGTEWPASSIGLPAPGVELQHLAETSAKSPTAHDRPTGLTPRPSPQVEGMRGRAVVFEVATQTTTTAERTDKQASADEAPPITEPSFSSAFVVPAVAAQPSYIAATAAVDAAHDASRPAQLAALVVERLADGHVAQAVAVQHTTSAAEAGSGAIALSEPSIAARDRALAEDLSAASGGNAAAIFDPTRNRPIIGVAAASLLLAARSLYSPRLPADQSPVEQRPRRRTSENG
jgi:hypothetical protein